MEDSFRFKSDSLKIATGVVALNQGCSNSRAYRQNHQNFIQQKIIPKPILKQVKLACRANHSFSSLPSSLSGTMSAASCAINC